VEGQTHRGMGGIFEKAGYNVRWTSDAPLHFTPDEVVWIQGNANWFPHLRAELTATPPEARPLVLIWHTEPLPLPSAAPHPWPRLRLHELAKILRRDPIATDAYTNYFRLRQLSKRGIPDILVVSTPSRQEFLAEKGIASHWVPFTYYKELGHDMKLTRDIDVLFLGTPDDPRHRRAIRYLQRRGVNVLSPGNWSDPAFWGERRTELINRTKIFLNIQRQPGKLSGLRMLLGMANKALVISEPIYNSAPYVSGEHYVTATLEEMPGVIDYYLTHAREREIVTKTAYRYIRRELKPRAMPRLFELIDTARRDRYSHRPALSSQ